MRHTNRDTQPRTGNRFAARDDADKMRRVVRERRADGQHFRRIADDLDIPLATAHRYARD